MLAGVNKVIASLGKGGEDEALMVLVLLHYVVAAFIQDLASD